MPASFTPLIMWKATIQPGFDSLDAFLAHMWAVTIVGAPKKAAAQAIEDREKTPRGWYGGAVGSLSLNGDINTGILIRTIHVRDGRCRVSRRRDAALRFHPRNGRAGDATESHRISLEHCGQSTQTTDEYRRSEPLAHRPKMLLVDNDDCFIHTLSNYARQTGAEVVTYRAGFPVELIDQLQPDLILISPGPGRPEDFHVPDLVLERRQAAHSCIRCLPWPARHR